MTDSQKQQSKVPESYAEVEKISRSMLVWANTFPEKPVDIIRYEQLRVEVSMALYTVQGAYIKKRYILGGHQGEYAFQIFYRIKPGDSNDARLDADALLNRFGDWARKNLPDLGDAVRPLRMEPTAQSSKMAAYEDGFEDYMIPMKLTYEIV